jgi:3-oxoacyl-[acyl-carrier protein] reductase
MAEDRPAALVTGSASGIGRAAALRLARAGYDVAVNYRRSEDSAHRAVAELEATRLRPEADLFGESRRV